MPALAERMGELARDPALRAALGAKAAQSARRRFARARLADELMPIYRLLSRGGGLMRVLHVSAGNLYGGLETVLVTLARYRALSPELECEFALCFAGQAGGRTARGRRNGASAGRSPRSMAA